jgi:hypothetical protein
MIPLHLQQDSLEGEALFALNILVPFNPKVFPFFTNI